MIEYEHEPIRGLPGDLPHGERILWQGAPDWRVFARSALHSRWIGVYFMLIAAIALVSGSVAGMAAALISAALVGGLLALFAWMVAKTTVYTLTNRRVVLRIGVALTKCINLPLSVIGSAELRELAGGYGDIALVPTAHHRLGYAMLWPHARPLRFSRPQPMLRALPDAARVAALLAEACAGVTPVLRPAEQRSAPVREAAA
ncbi:PH domain-containing protein [Qipengyuania sp. 6B39]|uniref:photosynthetic complex putative assembly protein PuhB n=1 Tax=Qipengyuania proteolytica TaxID=2867239 RepID=UPI001C8A70F0|nr:PH domain-containing protein [Qipengyuania proteolytica]